MIFKLNNYKYDKSINIIDNIYRSRNLKNENNKLIHFNKLKDIEKGATLLREAIQKKERICIVADYDADGATSCAIAIKGIKLFGGIVDFVVPNRFKNGYGLSPSVVDMAIEKNNPQLIITVDNGISSYEGVDYARKKNIKILITDHHLQLGDLPNANVIINPNRKDCSFESKNLAGCGVIYYLLSALKEEMIKINNNYKNVNISKLLDLVAIGTIADVVKIDNNNKSLIYYGLEMIKNGFSCSGIKSLIEISNCFENKITTTDIGFKIAPKINAAGRLEDMRLGIQCLIEEDKNITDNIALKLKEINEERKKIELDIKNIIINNNSINNNYIFYDPSFHEGVIGIVASRIKELTYLPTIIFTDSEDKDIIKGSCRSIKEIHIKDVLDYIYNHYPNLIIKFGGHAAAAGLSIHKSKYNEFCSAFEKTVIKFSYNNIFINEKIIDYELEKDYINIDNAKLIKQNIWGNGLEEPVFLSLFKIKSKKIIKDVHLKLELEINNQTINAIWFNNIDLKNEYKINLIYHLDVNYFNNKEYLQLRAIGEL